MKTINNPRLNRRIRTGLIGAGLLVGGLAFAGCGSGSSAAPSSTVGAAPAAAGSTAPAAAPGSSTAGTSAAAPSSAGGATSAGASQVLPVSANPIKNTSTVQALKIDSVLVENNVDPVTGKTTSDHLEIALSNSGTTPLTGVEIYYTFKEPTTGTTESYFAKLPDSFTVPAGGKRIANFDNTGAPDHFPVNDYSLYYTSKEKMEVTVTVSATNAAVQTTTIKKDAGGPEAAD